MTEPTRRARRIQNLVRRCSDCGIEREIPTDSQVVQVRCLCTPTGRIVWSVGEWVRQ